MATELFRRLGEMEFTNSGVPLAGGFVYYYRAGTTTLLSTFLDAAGATPNANPLPLDGNGRFQTSVYLGDIITMGFNYKQVVTSSTGVVISTLDDIPAAAAASSSAEFAPEFTPWTQITFAQSPLILTAADAGKAYEIDTTGGNITVSLPSAASVGNGRGLIFKKTGAANLVNIVGSIDGASSVQLFAQYEEIKISSNGAVYRLDKRYQLWPGGVGEVRAFAFPGIPGGWLECNGVAVPRTTYPGLFVAIGVSHGSGDGTTTFNLPDYRGRFQRGWDHGTGRDPNVGTRGASGTGGVIGDNVGSFQFDELETHSHNLFANLDAAGAVPTAANFAAVGRTAPGLNSDYSITGTATGATLGLTSTSGGLETRPVNIYVNYCIKV